MGFGHFHILLCDEIIFPLPSGKKVMDWGTKGWLRTSVQHFLPLAVEIPFLHSKVCENAIPVRNEGISVCNISINPLKNYQKFKKE